MREQMFVQRQQSGAAIHDKGDGGRVTRRCFGLRQDMGFKTPYAGRPVQQRGMGVQQDTACIYQAEAATRMMRRAFQPVARDAGLVVGNSAFAADKPVEERGLAHIGTAHQDDLRKFLHQAGLGLLLVGDAAERTLAGFAHRAAPTFRKILEGNSRRNFTPFIALGRVIQKSATAHLAAPHVFWLRHISSLLLSVSALVCRRRTDRVAQTVKFKAGSGYGKTRQYHMARVRHRHGDRDVGHPAAFLAAHMLMGLGDAVKTLAGAGGFDFKNFALFGKQIKVAVYRAQADARQALTHYVIELIRCRMSDYFAQFFKNNCALARNTLLLWSSILLH